jgi:adenylate cyclase
MNVVWLFAIASFHFLQLDPEMAPKYAEMVDANMVNPDYEFIYLFLAGVCLGTIFGGINIYANENQDRLRKKSYANIILSYSISHILLTAFTMALVIVIAQIIQTGKVSSNIIYSIIGFVNSLNFIRILLFSFFISISIIFFQLLSAKIGRKTLINLILGKFRQPKERNLIFLFMDLKSSTSYAEALGHQKYSLLIQDCFSDLNRSIETHKGVIYQYIGDEVVVIWPYEEGIKEGRCIDTFFCFKESINRRKDYYMQNYGLVPMFKAGINGGRLMAAEVGISKRSVAYHGDVINTASRIQCQCSQRNVDILVSEKIMKDSSDLNKYDFKYLDKVQFKGKTEKVAIYTIGDSFLN